MSTRETVAPATLSVDRREEGIAIRYLDGRETVYRQPPEPTTPPLTTRPGLLVQVLQVTDEFDSGILVYVNDRDSAAEILKDSGVGRINLQPGEAASLLPGIEVTMDGHQAVVDVDFAAVDGRVFVFEEGMLGSLAHELVEATD